MRLWTKLLLLGFLVLLINSAYLISFGEPTLFYIGNVLIHVLLGVALIIPFIVYVHKHFARMSIIGKGGMVFLGVGVISGVYLMFVGATTPNRWLLILHIVTVTLGAILFVGHLLIWAKRVETEFSHKAAQIAAIVFLISLLFPVGARLIQHYRPNPDYLVKNPLSPPTSMYEEGGGTDGPFFPASVETYTGDLIPTDFFLTSQTCAESGCHPGHLQTVARISTSLRLLQQSVVSEINYVYAGCQRNPTVQMVRWVSRPRYLAERRDGSTNPGKFAYTRRPSWACMYGVPLNGEGQGYDGQQRICHQVPTPA